MLGAVPAYSQRKEAAMTGLRFAGGGPASHLCPVTREKVDEDACVILSGNPATNIRACAGTLCSSPWRICKICAKQGRVIPPSEKLIRRETSVVVDARKGLCAFHERYGTDALRREAERPPLEEEGAQQARKPLTAVSAQNKAKENKSRVSKRPSRDAPKPLVLGGVLIVPFKLRVPSPRALRKRAT